MVLFNCVLNGLANLYVHNNLDMVGHKDPHLNFRAKFIIPPAVGIIYCNRLKNLELRLHRRKTFAEHHISIKGKILFFRLKRQMHKKHE